MNRFDNDDQQIKETLRQMPEINDTKSKDQLYRNISSRLKHQEKPRKSNRIIWIPVASGIMVLLLMILIIPPLFQDAMLQSSKESSTADTAIEESAQMEKFDAAGSGSGNNALMKEGESGAAEDSLPKASFLDRTATPHVINRISNGANLIHGALTDTQGQYVIPLSIIVSGTENKDYYYNKLSDYLNEEEWGLSNYIFQGAEFRINREKNQVHIAVPEGFEIGNGATGPNMFEDTLTAMFAPYGINQVIFNQEVELGPIGSVDRMALIPTTAIYKKFQSPEGDREFLVRIPIDKNSNFLAALTEMKKNEEVFHVDRVVPPELNFSVQREGPLLRLKFTNPEKLRHGQNTLFMIDAILMTAKSFGYQKVEFANSPIKNIGPYNLNEPINVPLGANPVNISQ